MASPTPSSRRSASKKLSARAAAWISSLSLLVFLIAAALVSQLYVNGRLDLTRDRQFTLSPAAIKTLDSLPDIITVRVVMSRDLPTQFQRLRTQAVDLLREFEARSGGKFNLVFEDPGEDEEKRKAALSLGIQEVQLQEQSRDGVQVKRGFFGLALLYGDKKEVFPAIQNLETFEYELIVRLIKLTGGTKTLGIVEGVDGNKFVLSLPGAPPMQGFDQAFMALRTNIEQLYKIAPQYPAWMPIGEDVDVLLVAAPQRLTPAEKFRIDQFAMLGKPVIFLTPGMNIEIGQGITGAPALNEYEDLLARYGVRVRKNVVLEPRQWEMVRFGNASFPSPYPYWIVVNYATLNPENPITAGLETMSFPWTSSLDLDSTAQPGLKSEPLVLTTAGAWEETGPVYLAPREMDKYVPVDQTMHMLAVLQSGSLKSAYAGVKADSAGQAAFPGVAPDELTLALKQSQEDARVLVVSSALFLSDFYLSYTNAAGNYHFLLNALDYLALDPSLINVRSRQIDEAPLDEEKVASLKTGLILANMGLVPLLLVVWGLAAGVRRRRRQRQIGEGPTA